MPVSDYLRKKPLEVTSQNDSGSTQDKAQPVLVKGEEDVESTQDAGTNDGGASPYSFDVDLSTKGIIDTVGFETSGDATVDVEIEDSSGNILASKSPSLSGDIWYTTSFTESDYSRIPDNETLTIVITTNGSPTCWYNDKSFTGNLFSVNATKFPAINNSGGGTAIQVSETTGTENKTGTGDIIISFDNIAGAEDIALYDQNGNLLDYEIESLDTAAETAVLWVYNSWVRDDTVQAQIAYGDNSANTDRQDVSGTWNNSAQNAELVQHLNESSYPSDNAIDSGPNGIDGTVTGATSVQGEIDGGASFDGTDDVIDMGTPTALEASVFGSNITLVSWLNTNDNTVKQEVLGKSSPNKNDNYRIFLNDVDNDGTAEICLYIDEGSENGTVGGQDGAPPITQNEWKHAVGTYDGSQAIIYDDTNSTIETNLSDSIVSANSTPVTIGARATGGDFFDGEIDSGRIYSDTKSPEWVQADYDASPKAGQVYFSQQAAENTLTFEGNTNTATATGTGGQTTISGTTTLEPNTATATGTGATIFIEPDFSTLSANATGTGGQTTVSGTTTLETNTATATGTGGTNLQISQILATTTATATGTGATIETDRLSGTVQVEGQPTSNVDVNIVDKTNNVLYETTTDSNGDWIIDAGDGVVYQVAYLFDDGSTYYGDAEESDTT